MTDAHKPARLLAGRDRLGRLEKDAIFEAVIAGTASQKPARAWWWFAVPVVAAAVIAIVVWPRAPEDELTARGGGSAHATFDATCGASRAATCERGAKLVFDLQGTTGYRYFGAFARGADGNVIWYFTARELAALDRGILGETVVIGEEVGTYRVYGVFSQTALDRDGIKALFDEAGRVRDVTGVRVVEKDLVIR